MLACVAISASFIISNSYILCLLISSDGLATLACLSFFLFLGGEILPSSHVLISWAGMHRCTAPDSYFFQFKERSSGGRAGCKCEGENLAITTCSLKPAALKKDWKHSSELSCVDLSRVHSRLLSRHCVTVLLICCFFGALIFIPIPNPCISSLLCLCAFH